ncbi:MAG: hypothetical protein HQ582_16795 [Planctomycetes bacterium]|nr:hypothetical protein [Planctomycetota bacterium]
MTRSAVMAIVLAGGLVFGGESPQSAVDEPLTGWQFFQTVKLPTEDGSPWIDVVLPPSVFDVARYGLDDLRLCDASGREIPYALRVRRQQDRKESFEAKEFNRAQGPDNCAQVTLDLGSNPQEHNAVEIEMPGTAFRRKTQLEGSSDGDNWLQLADKNLIRFHTASEKIEDLVLRYPPSRFRYLRARVFPDREVDKEPVDVGAVTVGRRVEVPGEMVALEGKLGPREATRESRAHASAWIIELGADNVPCSGIEVEIGDAEFVRDYRVEAGGPPDSDRPFRLAGSGHWQRRAGQQPVAMQAKFNAMPSKAEFTEVRASRLRLIVVDHGNDPLDVRSVKFIAPARQIVFARPEKPEGDFRLYFANPKAEAPHYDFAGNLPKRLEPPPLRAEFGPQETNPTYAPEPLPFTERWPWAIYVVLSSVSLVLGLVILSAANMAIAVHDAAQTSDDSSDGSQSGAVEAGSPFDGHEEDHET